MLNKQLFQEKCYIGGQWVNSKKTISVYDPSTQEIIGKIPDLESETIQQAITAAEQAWPCWRSKTAEERAQLLIRWHELILENCQELALLLTTE